MADFNSIAEMMQSLAAEAVHSAQENYGFSLDYSHRSIESLETILANVSVHLDASDKGAVEESVKLWGSYFGETVLRTCGGTWELIQYPGRIAAIPTLVIEGSQLYPLMKVHRRLTMGESENVLKFFEKIRSRLSPVHPTEQSSK